MDKIKIHILRTGEGNGRCGSGKVLWCARAVASMASSLQAKQASSAVNQQKSSFEYVGMNKGGVRNVDNIVEGTRHQVRAKKGVSMIGYTQMDLGIAKYHFELGAGKNNFEWV